MFKVLVVTATIVASVRADTCVEGSPNCFTELVYTDSADGSCGQNAPALELTLLADGNCNYLNASGEWYQLTCDGDGALAGESRCDSDDCSSCILDSTEAEALPTDDSCFTRPYGGDGQDIDIQLKGTCAAPICVEGSPNCFTELVYTDSADGSCGQNAPALEITLLADGNCNFLATSGEWYQVTCDGDGALVGKSRCDSDDCSSCILDITEAEALPTDDSCFTRPCNAKGNQVGCLRVAGCAWTGEQASSGTCHLIDCAAQATCEDCAYKGCGWQLGACQGVPGGSKQGADPCPVQDVGCWTVPDQATYQPVTGFCEDDAGSSSSRVVVGPAAFVALVAAAVIF
eukprot:gene22278-924_t